MYRTCGIVANRGTARQKWQDENGHTIITGLNEDPNEVDHVPLQNALSLPGRLHEMQDPQGAVRRT